jgi:hypothetical protein
VVDRNGPKFPCSFETSLGIRARAFGEFLKIPDDWEEWTRRNTTKFVFDEYPPDALADFGMDLVREGVFALPFDYCYFEWPRDGCVNSLIAQNSKNGESVLLWIAAHGGNVGQSPALPVSFSMEALRHDLKTDEGTAFHIPFAPTEKFADKFKDSEGAELMQETGKI